MDSEFELIKKLKNPASKERAFRELLDTYQERLYWHIRKIVGTHENADDVLQNTFIRIYKSIQNFQEKSTLHTWMYRIAYNESIRFLEKQQKRTAVSMDEIASSHFKNLLQDAYFDGNDLQRKLQRIISEFTEKQQRVFQMKYFDDLSFKQISEVLQIPESTLKSSYYTAVKIVEEKIIE